MTTIKTTHSYTHDRLASWATVTFGTSMQEPPRGRKEF